MEKIAGLCLVLISIVEQWIPDPNRLTTLGIPKVNQHSGSTRTVELTTNGISRKQDSYSFNYPSSNEETRRKRTFEFPSLLKSRIDSNKVLFPKGVLSKVREGSDDIPPVKRIELFAKDRGETYGIIRSMFVGFSSEKSILQIAEATRGVVQVRPVRSSNGKSNEYGLTEKTRDILILKRSPEVSPDTAHSVGFRVKIPSITVPPRWKDRMKLEDGDCLMISNPIEEYAVPPPNV